MAIEPRRLERMAKSSSRALGLLISLTGKLADDALVLEPRVVGPDWMLFPLTIEGRAVAAADVASQAQRDAIALGLAYRSWVLLRDQRALASLVLPPLRALDRAPLRTLRYERLRERAAERRWVIVANRVSEVPLRADSWPEAPPVGLPLPTIGSPAVVSARDRALASWRGEPVVAVFVAPAGGREVFLGESIVAEGEDYIAVELGESGERIPSLGEQIRRGGSARERFGRTLAEVYFEALSRRRDAKGVLVAPISWVESLSSTRNYRAIARELLRMGALRIEVDVELERARRASPTMADALWAAVKLPRWAEAGRRRGEPLPADVVRARFRVAPRAATSARFTIPASTSVDPEELRELMLADGFRVRTRRSDEELEIVGRRPDALLAVRLGAALGGSRRVQIVCADLVTERGRA